MKGKQLRVLIGLLVYVIVIGSLTIYHAYNFSNYTHTKGDESINYTFFLLLTSIIFQGVLWMAKKNTWKYSILATLVNYILSFFLGFSILMLSGLSGIPKHLILIYSGCYLILFSGIVILQINKN